MEHSSPAPALRLWSCDISAELVNAEVILGLKESLTSQVALWSYQETVIIVWLPLFSEAGIWQTAGFKELLVAQRDPKNLNQIHC